MSIPEDEEPLDERYADEHWRPVRGAYPLHQPRRERSDALQWGPLLAAAAAGFLIAVFGPCRRADPQREDELAKLQSELGIARDRVAQLESQLAGAPVAEAGSTDAETDAKIEAKADAMADTSERRASGREPQAAPAPKPERRSELTPEEVLKLERASANAEAAREAEPPAATTPPPTSSPSPEPTREPERVALAEPQSAISVYVVPDPAAPVVRSTSRSDQPDVAALQVLAPEQAGWTTEAQPTLYWHASEGMLFPGEFTLTREGAEEPMVRGRFPAPDPGIQRIELSQFGISLEEGASYRWKVAFADPAGGASATGGIRRVAPPDAPRATGAAEVTERLDALERAGLWYDALDLVIRSIENNSGAKDLVARRRAMLARVEIHLPSS